MTLELRAVPLTESKPYADFPTLFEHDAPLLFSQCGGPLVDLDGDAVGITIYRGQYGCMAIPGDCVKRLLPMLKSDGLADKWTKPAFPPRRRGTSHRVGTSRANQQMADATTSGVPQC